MRISKAALTLAAIAGSALALPALTNSALAVQDQPVTIGGIETVCTGVGSAKDNPAWSAYPIKLVFANPKGEDLAQVQVSVMQGGKPVIQTQCDAPWVLMKLPAGAYSVTATVPGQAGARVGKADFTAAASGQKTVTVTMPPSAAPAQ